MTGAQSRQAQAHGAKGAHILVVDDDERIRTLLSRFLMSEGYLVSAAANAEEATIRLRDLAFDLIVLDVMMPGESGMQFAARVRAREEPVRSAPILMLTALTETEDRVTGLEAGVDDYLAKPFDPRELSLRIASILRRTRPAPTQPGVAWFGDYAFDIERGELTRAGRPIRLTSRERDLLCVLAASGGAIVSRRTLARRDGAATDDASSHSASERSVDVEIARLRRKIETDSNMPRRLQTVRGQGYRLLTEPPRAAVPQN